MSLTGELPEGFKANVRIEPRCRRDDFSSGLAASIADPLWFLTRQWQTGELWGEDAGSPISVTLEYATQPLTRMRSGDDGIIEDLPAGPLETSVEQEQLHLSWRDRVQIGQQFERFIRDTFVLGEEAQARATLQAYRDDDEYVLKLSEADEWTDIDRATRRYLKLVRGRVLDGAKLIKKIDFSNVNPHQIRLLGHIDQNQLDNIVIRFKNWCGALNIQPIATRAPAWRNQQLDYRFEINPSEQDPPDKTHLIAPDYRNGALDWYTFNIANEVQTNWTTHNTVMSPPQRVSIGGSSSRWWAFEDAATNFGNLDVAKPDLARLLLMEYVLIYGDDWYALPLPVHMPNMVKIINMDVFNVFSEHIPIDPARQPHPNPLLRFDLFTLSPVVNSEHLGLGDPDAPGSPILLLPPVPGYREESPALEEIRFLRDENANKVWGVEHIVTNGLTRPVDGFDAQRERIQRRHEAEIAVINQRLEDIAEQLSTGDLSDEERADLEAEAVTNRQRIILLSEGSTPSPSEVPSYRLATTVPENWIPFAPFNAALLFGLDYPSIRLRRAQMLRNTDDEEPTTIPAMSRLLDLEEDPLLWLEEISVPRSGVRVQLTGQRVRWTDGKTYVWRGRKVLTGRGEGSSGLRFDYVPVTCQKAY